MYVRKFIYLLLLFVLMIIGCAQQHNVEINHINEPQVGAISEQANKFKEESITITEPNDVLTLDHALALTLLHNPELKVFSLETRVAQARQLQASLWPNPEIEFEAEELGGAGERSGFDAAETTIQLSQVIELGDRSKKRTQVASFENELAQLDYQNKLLEVFSEASKAFVSVLKAQQQLQLSNELLKLAEDSFGTVEKIVNAGMESPIEKTRASIALSNIKIMHQEALRDLEYSKRQLASFWGQDKPLFNEVAGNMENIEQLPESEVLINQLKINPQYVKWETEIKKAKAQLDLEKSKAMGDVTIGAGVQRFNETDDNAVVLGISIPLPVSDRNQGAKQEAVYNVIKSRESQKAQWLKLQNEFNKTFQEYTNSYNQVTSLKNEILPAVTEMFNAAVKAYEQGKLDYLNLLDAQRTFFDVKNQYIESLAAYHFSKIEIERLTSKKIKTVTISESED